MQKLENIVVNYDLACEYGYEGALLLQNFAFWININKKKNVNYHDGKYWTYISVSDIQRKYRFLDSNKIRRIIEKLCVIGKITKQKFYNKIYKTTLWYAFEDQELFNNIIRNFNKQNLKDCDNEIPNCQNEIPLEDENSKDISLDDDIKNLSSSLKEILLFNKLKLEKHLIEKIVKTFIEYNKTKKLDFKEYITDKIKQFIYIKNNHLYVLRKYDSHKQYLYLTLSRIEWYEKYYLDYKKSLENNNLSKEYKQQEERQRQEEKQLFDYYLNEFYKLPISEQQKIDKVIRNKISKHKLLNKILQDKNLYQTKRDRERVEIMTNRVGEGNKKIA